MHISTSLLALTALCPSILAQSKPQSAGQRYLASKTGYSITRIFAPISIGAAKIITPVGSEAATTTWGVDDTFASSFTLGPNTAINTFTYHYQLPQTANGTTYANATRILNCAYTPSTRSQAMTAECVQTMQYANANVRTTAYNTTTYPRPTTETTYIAGYAGLENGKVSAWDGMIYVYVATTDGQVVTGTKEGGEVVTSTVGGGVPQMTAMVQAVVVMAAGAAAKAV